MLFIYYLVVDSRAKLATGPCWNLTENAIYTGINMTWKPLKADGSRTENTIYIVIAAKKEKWRVVEGE